LLEQAVNKDYTKRLILTFEMTELLNWKRAYTLKTFTPTVQSSLLKVTHSHFVFRPQQLLLTDHGKPVFNRL
jgi:hypothetical protein